MKIAVAGGTGTVGVHVVDVARAQGHEVVVLSRATGVDLVSGKGLTAALQGVNVVVDVTSKQTMSAKASVSFFRTVTENLLDAEEAQGVQHHVALSIVGIDHAPRSYYAGKAAQERAVRGGPIPWTILRATQFHEFASQIYGQIHIGPVMIVPAMRSQPVAAHEVAERLVRLAEGDAQGRARDLGGPQEERMADMVRRYAKSIRSRARIIELPLPGAYGKALRDGSLLTGADADLGNQTFGRWLD
nr:SDR family oxidoreductase [Rhodococcus sp. (in: high G+C Gram-positive bacteria)]